MPMCAPLANGATTDQLFDLVERVRKKTEVPMVFLLYANSVFKYGYERFCKRCQEAGIDGLIIPDLPFEEKRGIVSNRTRTWRGRDLADRADVGRTDQNDRIGCFRLPVHRIIDGRDRDSSGDYDRSFFYYKGG